MESSVNKEYGAFAELMRIRGKEQIHQEEVNIINSEPLYKTPFKVDEVSAQILAARGVAANDLWELRTGNRQKIGVNMRAAAATSLSGSDMTLKKDIRGKFKPIPVSESMKHMISLTQPWETADGNWFLPHTNLPHLEKRVLNILNCQSTPDSIRLGVNKWNALELENTVADELACGGMVRTPEEWLKHPQGAYLDSKPVVEIIKIAEGEPEPLPEGVSPASGIRVLDLTRILAGPTAGLGFAEHGADVLMVTAPHLPQVESFVRDTSHGKRSCFLDLNIQEEASKLRSLVQDSDIFIDGYRPGRLEAHGFGSDDLFKLRPGLIHIDVNCFGSGGPFATRAGWDQVAQAVTGLCHIEGQYTPDKTPKLMPVFTCDFLTGYLATFGGLVALYRRATEGGSYKVNVSLCQSAMLLQRQGMQDNFQNAPGKLSPQEFDAFSLQQESTPYGDLKCLAPVLSMSETPCKWLTKTPELGSHQAEWLTREASKYQKN
ncbi:CoA transferase [Vibrio viridaestus]|uniref:CoA transferase n=1 Tax=Vibrio viridaestus TaxID=2487322 RepID=A0A3N9TAH3_9VIBR|nr:CoA transferase [Vibrio viridaestus]RQW61098.1 CoA transferase [Vibrio viridaestus]